MASPFSVSPETLAAFRRESGAIAAATVSRALERKSEVAHHGEDASRLLASGIEFTMRMLDAAMATGEGALLDDELRWALDRLPHDGVSPGHMLSRFALLRGVMNERLPAAAATEVASVVAWMEKRLAELAGGEKA